MAKDVGPELVKVISICCLNETILTHL
jgi:hypothetical protein